MNQNVTLLEVENLKTYFNTDEGVVKAVDGISFNLDRGKTLGIVGESGCGKSVLARSILKMVRPPGQEMGGTITYHRSTQTTSGDNVHTEIDISSLESNGSEMRDIRGSEMTMIFQEPMVSFSPVHTIGHQIIEGIMLHQSVDKTEAREKAISILQRVGIADPERNIDAYSFNLSGGMRQRCMIAMALSCNPTLLIADEPTTALDVTTQAQILELIKELQQDFGMAIMLITHNLGVIAQMAEEVIVMYLGKVVERADVHTLFNDPKHPYTQELLKSVPQLRSVRATERLAAIEGNVPLPTLRPSGCPFHPRCPQFVSGLCDEQEPQMVSFENGHEASCLLYSESLATHEEAST